MGNWNSGRRPQPTALKVLRGNPGKRPLNVDEPQIIKSVRGAGYILVGPVTSA